MKFTFLGRTSTHTTKVSKVIAAKHELEQAMGMSIETYRRESQHYTELQNKTTRATQSGAIYARRVVSENGSKI